MAHSLKKFLLSITLVGLSNFSNAATPIDTSVQQFNDFYHDFQQNNFTLSKAILFKIFLKTHENDLAQYASASSKLPPQFQFIEECDGAVNALTILNGEFFKWSDMWNAKGKERFTLYMLDQDLNMMSSELNYQ